MFNSLAKTSIAACALLLSSPSFSQSSSPQIATPAANDYSKAETWLCRPGRQDACAVDLTTTIVAADGKLKKELFKADANAPIDCFYVYPTVSLDATPNSDMTAGPEENSVVRAQFARFASQCKLYAPLYRQVTLKALRAAMAGDALSADRKLGYNDVLAAWNHYLQNDNKGRGVVLIGHSQGSTVLTQLIKNEIDGKPIQAKILSALLLGTNVAVPKGKDVGGSFQNFPLCRSTSQLGCAISYVTFRADAPPPANSRFGRVPMEGMQAACVNPASLQGGKAEMHAYLSNGSNGVSAESAQPKPWATRAKVDTPFVSLPGLLSGECVSNDDDSYLAITTNGDPADPRTDEITGDVVVNGQILKDWGLHLIDAHVAMGNLIDVVAQQSKAYLKK
jgi:hypothetical protein